MKRSEMVELMRRFMCANFHTVVSIAETDMLLTYIEKCGMLAPEIKNPEVKQTTFFAHATEKALDKLYKREPGVPYDYYVNKWEEDKEE